MKPYRLEQLTHVVKRHFDERSVQTVLGWFKANEGRRPVIVVGAGYTRNAKKKNADTRADAPLWPQLAADLASDLSIDANFSQGAYDALTLAELYQEEFGPNALHNKLLSLAEDAEYEPDEAHEALLAYEAESVITTNFLDTVLDKGRTSCFRVIQDSDLAIYDRQAQKKQLIYFHGHRDNRDSWVFTRSQYEDVFKTRPVVAIRVRQLLSQYPVLAVGYSLSDPDFHQIYRQLNLDMANRHPLGLAILVREPLTAERRHWECLGLRIAVLKGPDLHEAFARFFKLDPNGPLPPVGSDRSDPHKSSADTKHLRASEDDGSDAGDLRAALSKIDSFDSRQQYLRDIWDEDDKRQARDVTYKSPYSDHDSYMLWLACVEQEIPKEERDKIERPRRVTLEKTGAETGKPGGPQGPEVARGFSRLPAERFSSEWRFARIVDVLLTCRSELQESLARWIATGIEREFLGKNGDDSDANYVDMLSWLSRWIVEKTSRPSDAQRVRREARRAFSMCLQHARKYYPEKIQGRILEDVKVLVANGMPTAQDERAAFNEAPTDLTRSLEQAFKDALNGEWKAAWDAYGTAAELAHKQKDPFAYWVALRGQIAHASWDWRDQSYAIRQERVRRLNDLIDHAEKDPKVRRWIERRDQRLQELERDTIKELKKRERQRAFPSRSWSFNNYAHNLWRMYRDLESMYAAPSQQVELLRPLLEHDAYSASRDEELALRLKFNIDKTSDWIELLESQCRDSVNEQTEFDTKLMVVFKKDSSSKTELRARLEALPAIIRICGHLDLPWVADFLVECKKQLGPEVRTYGADCFLFRDYPKAWCAYATQMIEPSVLDDLIKYAPTAEAGIEREEFIKRLTRLPWEVWLACDVATPDALVALIYSCLGEANEDGALSGEDEGVGWSLYEVVRFAREFERTPLSEPLVQRARAWAAGALTKENAETHLSHVYRAPVHLGWILTEGDDEARVRHIEAALALVSRARQQSGDDERERAGVRTAAAVLADLLDLGVPVDLVRADVTAIWELVDGRWSRLKASLRMNPHMISPYDYFLVEGIATRALPDLAGAREKLLELVEISSDVLPNLARILDPTHWSEHWPKLVEHVWLTVGGHRGEESMPRLLSALSLWLNWLNEKDGPQDLPEDLRVLVDVGLLAVSNENHLVANSAAYGVVRYADRKDLGRHLKPVVAALRNIAQDPRVAVRHGAAFGAGWLGHVAGQEVIRDLAREIGAQLKDDPNAWIQRQLKFGEAKGRVEARKRNAFRLA